MKLLQRVHSYSNSKLETETHLAVSREKQAIANLLVHLSEVAKRRLYAQRGKSSLQDYCIGVLNYPPSSAYRRAAAAKFILEFPEAVEKIESGELTLTTLVEIQSRRLKVLREQREAQKNEKKKKPNPQAERLPAQPAKETKPLSEKPLDKNETRNLIDLLSGKNAAEASRDIAEAFATPCADTKKKRALPRGRETPVSRKQTKLEVYLEE